MSVMDLAGTCSSFQSDLDFCSDCGSVLPLPGAQDTVTCTRCGFNINVRDFEGKVVKTSVVFHQLGTAMPMSVEEGPECQGPVFLPRLTGAAPDVVMKEWHTTPDRCVQPMKGKLSSTPVPTASALKHYQAGITLNKFLASCFLEQTDSMNLSCKSMFQEKEDS
ncbi:DNA-directed RNA polymerase I subunit RPA12 isoform X1 [Macaca nemestrina]